jgi:regulator of protease activity HflC (stomatin/prohibitin superfamily)
MKGLMISLSALALTACGYAAPDAGQQGVLTRKPWFFGSGGVDMTPIQTGSKIVASSTHVDYVPITPLAFDIGFDNMMPKDGIPLDFHSTVRIQIADAPELVRDWNGADRNDKGELSYNWFWANISPVYSNMVRQEVKNFTMQQLAFEGAAVDQIDQVVAAKLNDFIRKNKMPVRLLSVTIGRAIPPNEILAQRTETAEQQQRKLTMDAQTQAELARKNSEQARAEADTAYRVSSNLSVEQNIELKRIEALKQACSQGTCIFGNVTPLLNTK